MKKKPIVLDCGVEAQSYGKSNIELDITDIHHGHGEFNNLPKFIEVLTELNNKGYKMDGMYIQEGIYGGVDKLTLEFYKTN
jgi:hypothetical protein